MVNYARAQIGSEMKSGTETESGHFCTDDTKKKEKKKKVG